MRKGLAVGLSAALALFALASPSHAGDVSVTCVCAQVSGVGPACQIMKLRKNDRFDLTDVTVANTTANDQSITVSTNGAIICVPGTGCAPAFPTYAVKAGTTVTQTFATPIRYTGGQGVTELDAFCSVADEKLSITVSGRQ